MTSTRTEAATSSTTGIRRMLLEGLAAAIVAAVATAAVAAAGRAAGISLDVAGGPIPPSGFATLTVVFSLVGLVIAAGLRRFARRPRSTFVRVTVVLTLLSLVPDVIANAGWATRLLLILTHLVAAAIVIPVIARRLPVERSVTS
ncbi:DUF6069 family protein [Catenuloplanes sp. NPDC051500]|uniref:DUF6069 family protein n=1 Tax=Catenuloplanes sp. NPDC051500 TaxID=3363959 RepID=UPI00378D0AC2